MPFLVQLRTIATVKRLILPKAISQMIDLYPTVVRKNVPFVAYISPFCLVISHRNECRRYPRLRLLSLPSPRPPPSRATFGDKTPDAAAGVQQRQQINSRIR